MQSGSAIPDRHCAKRAALLVAPVFALCLASCQGEQAHNSGPAGKSDGTQVAASAPSTGNSPMTPRRELMLHVMQRNAEQLWDWISYSANGGGAGYASPKTDDDWMNAESDALTLVELTKVLQTEDYRIDDPDWPKFVANLRSAAQESATAAESKNFEAMLAVSDKINAQCIACHMHYVPEIEVRPK